MQTPLPRQPNEESFVAEHHTMDERLDEAFKRYDKAFHAHSRELVEARMNLALLLWNDEDPPPEVTDQLAVDGEVLLRDTPPLPERS